MRGYSKKLTARTRANVYQISQQLDIEKEYPANQRFEYSFQLKAPDAAPNPQLGGNLGTVLNILQTFAAPNPINWYVKAKLDVFGFDLNKSVQIMIS